MVTDQHAPTLSGTCTPTASSEELSLSPTSVLPLPPGFTPEGVEIALIDQQTLYLIEHAIPGGRDVFLHLLYYATTRPETAMQRSLFTATGESNDEAIALICSVEALAKSPRSPFKSPDAYLRRLLVLEYLQVVRRVFHRTYTEFRIPLGRRMLHIPTLLASLWELHEAYKDEKVKQLARKVAKRLQMDEFLAQVAIPQQTALAPDLAPVLGVLTGILEAHGLREDVTLLSEACSIIAGLLVPEKFGRVDAKVGEFLTALRRRHPVARKKTGDSVGQVGDSAAGETCPPDQLQRARMTETGEFPTTESPICKGKPQKRRSFRRNSGELAALFTMNSPKFGQVGQIFAKTGDSAAGVSIIALSPQNITYKGGTIIDAGGCESANPSVGAPSVQLENRPLEEIRREAKFYESFFDNGRSRKWTGSLINVLRETPKEIKRLAAVGAVFYSYFPQPDGRTVYSPGGWFTSACRRYSQPGVAVPSEVRAWAETHLPLKEIRRRIKEGSRLPEEQTLPWVGASEPVEADEHQDELPQEHAMTTEWDDVQAFDDSQQSAYPLPIAPTRSCLGSWMDYEQAERLQDRILREGAMYCLRAEVRPGQGERCTVVVTWPGRPGEIEIINEEDWIDYFREVKECFDELQ